MISTEQCSLFTIACPMPECYVEKGGERKLKTVNRITIVTPKIYDGSLSLVHLVKTSNGNDTG